MRFRLVQVDDCNAWFDHATVGWRLLVRADDGAEHPMPELHEINYYNQRSAWNICRAAINASDYRSDRRGLYWLTRTAAEKALKAARRAAAEEKGRGADAC